MQRLKTSMKHARTFKFTHAISGLTMTEGQLYKVEDTIGMLILDIQYTSAGCKAAKTITEGDDGVLIYNAEKIEVDKRTRTGDAFLPGYNVYWSGQQGAAVQPDYQSGFYEIGKCVKAAGASDSTVIIDLKGDKASTTHPL